MNQSGRSTGTNRSCDSCGASLRRASLRRASLRCGISGNGLLRSLWILFASALWLAGMASADAATGKMLIHLDRATQGDYLYWFSMRSDVSSPKPLPRPTVTGLVAVEIPAGFNESGAALELLDEKYARVAHLPVRDFTAFRAPQIIDGPTVIPVTELGNQYSRYWTTVGDEPEMTQWLFPDEHSPAGGDHKVFRALIGKAPSSDDQIQFYHSGINVGPGRQYKLLFWARADKKRTIRVRLTTDSEPFTALGLDRSASVGKSWGRTVWTFTTGSEVSACRLAVLLGQQPGQVDISGIELRPLVLSRPSSIASHAPVALTTRMFVYVKSASVSVRYRGAPVQNVLVTLKQGDKIFGQYWLQATDLGTASFSDVPLNARLTILVSNGRRTARFDRKSMSAALAEIALPSDWQGVSTIAAITTPALPPPAEPPVPVLDSTGIRVPQPNVSSTPQPSPGTSSPGTLAPGTLAPGNIESSAVQALRTAIPSIPPPIAAPLTPISPQGRSVQIGLVIAGVAAIVLAAGLIYRFTEGRRFRALLQKTQSAVSAQVLTSEPTMRLSLDELMLAHAPVADAEARREAAFHVRTDTLPQPAPQARTEVGPRMLGLNGACAGLIYELTQEHVEFGRDPSNHVVITGDRSASRRHAELRFNRGEFVLQDKGSSNGTFVNGVRLMPEQCRVLAPGDRIEMGAALFEFDA